MQGIADGNKSWYKEEMELAGVDLNLLVALNALLDERSVTRAASRVGLSQPGMSNTLARLRKLFGDPLLVIEPAEIMPEVALPAQRLFADRWLCCVWARSTAATGRMTMDTYLRLGHVVYSMGRNQPVSLVDEYLARAKVPRRVEFTVESF